MNNMFDVESRDTDHILFPEAAESGCWFIFAEAEQLL